MNIKTIKHYWPLTVWTVQEVLIIGLLFTVMGFCSYVFIWGSVTWPGAAYSPAYTVIGIIVGLLDIYFLFFTVDEARRKFRAMKRRLKSSL